MSGEKLVCPRCGADKHYKVGKSELGKQKYQCRECGRMFMDPKDYKVYEGVACPDCGGKTRKYGRRILSSGLWKQRYRCKKCNRSFYLPPKEGEG